MSDLVQLSAGYRAMIGGSVIDLDAERRARLREQIARPRRTRPVRNSGRVIATPSIAKPGPVLGRDGPDAA